MVQRLKQLSRRHEHPRRAAHPPATHGVDPKAGRARGAQERRSAGSTGACFSLNSLALFALFALFALYLSALWAWHQSGLSDCKLNGLYLAVAPVVRTHPYFAVSVCGSSPETIVAVSGKVIAIPVF